jgi:hypothetical protein
LVGIESEQLVFDYLSRVGDLAHSTSMTAAERARLVSGLRGEIDRLRAEEGGAVTKSAVRKILTRLGEPEDVVAGAHGGDASGGTSAAATPSSGSGSDSGSGSGSVSGFGSGFGSSDARPKTSLRKRPAIPRPARTPRTSAETSPPAPTAAYGASAPHLAGMDELGPEESNPDWWRLDPSPPHGGVGGGGGGRPFGEPVPGFIGGIELPEVLKRPDENVPVTIPAQGRDPLGGTGAGTGAGGGPAAAGEPAGAVPEAGAGALGWRRVLRRGAGAGAADAGPRAGGVVEWAAVLLLLAGAVIGSLIPLAAGWLAAWWSPRLTRVEAKWGAAGMPGIVAGGALVWLWGRVGGKWGEAIHSGDAGVQRVLADEWPVLLRVAAVASALFLVWRARRPRRG